MRVVFEAEISSAARHLRRSAWSCQKLRESNLLSDREILLYLLLLDCSKLLFHLALNLIDDLLDLVARDGGRLLDDLDSKLDFTLEFIDALKLSTTFKAYSSHLLLVPLELIDDLSVHGAELDSELKDILDAQEASTVDGASEMHANDLLHDNGRSSTSMDL